MPAIEVAEIDPRKPASRTVQKLLGKVQPRRRMAALGEGPGQKTRAGGQVEHAELGRERQPGQHVPVLWEKMTLDDGVKGRHPVYSTDVHTAEDRLRFYASRFPVVEVDSSYCGLPSSRNASPWAERTPDGFVFDVKAYRLFTQHQTPPDALPKDIREGLAPSKKNLYFNN
jgi:hypothetical protein